MESEPTTIRDETVAHWASGWTLSSPDASLLRETFSPLRVALSEKTGTILIATPKIKGELFMTEPADGALSLFATGFRLTRETEEGTRLFSFFKPQPSALVIEADDPHLDFISDGEIEQMNDGDTVVATMGQHRLTIVVDWKRSPVRMAVLSGSGDPEQLALRARGLLNTSAHLALDNLLKGRDQASHNPAAIDPLSYLKGRLRPATPEWPGPWLANQEEQPVFDSELQFLLAHALDATNSLLLPRVVKTTLATLADQAPTAPVIAGIARAPLLLQIMQRFPDRDDSWLAMIPETIKGMELYLDEIGKPGAIIPGAVSPLATKLRPWLWLNERRAWKSLAGKAGIPVSGTVPSPPVSRADDPPWLRMLDEDRVASLPLDEMEESLEVITGSLGSEDSEDQPLHWAIALWLMNSAALMARPTLRGAFREKLVQLASADWAKRAASMRVNGEIVSDTNTLASAAMAAWASHAPVDDPARQSTTGRAVLWRLSNRRRRLVALAGLALVIFAGWVISVQFRSSLPPSTFETRIGMIQHYYQTGELDEALLKLDELQDLRALNPGIISSWRGKVLYRQGHYAEAEASFAEAAEDLEANPAPRFNQALSQFKQGKHRSAAQSFEALAGQFKATHPATAARALSAAAISGDMATSHER